MSETNLTETFPCPECQAGKMHRKYITYMTYIGSELITVPDFPAWVCDVCGRREYDNHALNQLSLLLSPAAGKKASKKPKLSGRVQVPPKEPRSVKTDK